MKTLDKEKHENGHNNHAKGKINGGGDDDKDKDDDLEAIDELDDDNVVITAEGKATVTVEEDDDEEEDDDKKNKKKNVEDLEHNDHRTSHGASWWDKSNHLQELITIMKVMSQRFLMLRVKKNKLLN